MKIYKEPIIPLLKEVDDQTSIAIGPCRRTLEEYTTSPFKTVGYLSWVLKKAPIQDCLPELSLEDREFLISGLSPKGWHEIFGDTEQVSYIYDVNKENKGYEVDAKIY